MADPLTTIDRGRPDRAQEGYITLTGAGHVLKLMLGSDAPTPAPPTATLEEQARDNGKPVLVWKGSTLRRLKVPVLLDGWLDNIDQQPAMNTLEALADGSTSHPPEVVATGTIPYPGMTWWIESLDVGASLSVGGLLLRREVTIGLVEPQSPTPVPVFTGSPQANAPKGQAKSYTVKKGETLHKIAAKLLGDASKWKQIGTLNDIRDPRKELKAGRVLRLP